MVADWPSSRNDNCRVLTPLAGVAPLISTAKLTFGPRRVMFGFEARVIGVEPLGNAVRLLNETVSALAVENDPIPKIRVQIKMKIG